MSKLTKDSIAWIKSLTEGEKVIVHEDGKRYYGTFMGIQNDVIREDFGYCCIDAEYAKIETVDYRDIFPLFPNSEEDGKEKE